MRLAPPLAAALLVGALAVTTKSTTLVAQPAAPEAPRGGLTAFKSEAELRAFLRSLRRAESRSNYADVVSAPSPAPVAVEAASSQEISVTGSRVSNPGITNNQEADVDEGGIVKMRGDTLVILRRGRVFTVSLAGGRMRPIDSIDAFPPGAQARGDWYDEMLISGDRVIVVGYSYSRGGTEINRFRLDPAGRLRFEDAWHLRSNDYYSSRNYASRLIGNRLVFYTPLYLGWRNDPLEALPGIRRWQNGGRDRGFKRIAGPSQVFIAPEIKRSRQGVDALHSVTSCDLTAADLGCSATAVLGPSSRTFYVSSQGVYLWIADGWRRHGPSSGPSAFIYRLPFGRERPSAVAARGAPVDQFSFREDPVDGILNVLVRQEGRGDAMFAPEGTAGGVALIRVRFSDFGDGSREVPRSRYRFLPSAGGESWSFHNRFAGDYVLYGMGGGYGYGSPGQEDGRHTIVVVPLRSGSAAELPVPHPIDRIELIGGDAMAIGSTPRGLGFSTVELDGSGPRLGDRYVHPDSAEGETRSHAFFYSPDPRSPNGSSGLLGLPVARRADPAFARFFGSSAAMLFLRRERRNLSPAGELAASNLGVVEDNCQASCVDWYGNARPIFLGRRTFALLGYELVEGRLDGDRIRETGRISFAPRAVTRRE